MRRPLCLFALVLAAAVRLAIFVWPPDFPSCRDLDGRDIELTGRVDSKEFRKNARGETYLQITLTHIGDVSGMTQRRTKTYSVLCSASEDPERADRLSPVGSRIRIEGMMHCFSEASNPGEFDSRLYYRILDCEFRVSDIHILAASASADPLAEHLYYVKRYLASVLDRCCHENDAAVLKAMLLGEKGMIDAETKGLYQGSGIVHILSISGLHVSLLAMGLYRILKKIRLPDPYASVLSVAALFLYGKMTGMGASTFRASVMFVMYMTAKQIRRTYDLLTGAAVAAILLILQQPLYLLHSGFLFSFGAVIALGLLAPCFPEKLSFLAVPLANLPVYLGFYYTFPLYSLILNLIVIPLMTGVMVSAVAAMGIGALGGTVFLAAARFAAVPASLILRFYEFLCKAFRKLPGYTLVPGAPAAWQVFLYLFMLAVFVAAQQSETLKKYAAALPPHIQHIHLKSRHIVRIDLQKEVGRRMQVLGGIWLAAAVIVLCLRFRSGFYMDILDVGQGDGIYMECEGTRIFVDGGSTTRQNVGKYQIEPFLKHEGASKIDFLILTHDDEDHCSGMKELLEDSLAGSGIRIERLVLPDIADELKGENYRKLEELAQRGRIPVLRISRGRQIRAGNMTLTCMGPAAGENYSGANASSVILLVQYRGFSCLLTGDLEKDGEKAFLDYAKGDRRLKNLTLLKVAHHGSKYATTEAFLEAVSARYAVISCGWRNTYGHPAKETVQRLEDAGMEIFDTRYAGCVQVRVEEPMRTFLFGDIIPVRTFLFGTRKGKTAYVGTIETGSDGNRKTCTEGRAVQAQVRKFFRSGFGERPDRHDADK